MTEIFALCRHNPRLSSEELERRVMARGGCFDTLHVQWQHLLVMEDGALTLSHLHSPDAESARIALRNAGFTIDHLWSTGRTGHEENLQTVNGVLDYRGTDSLSPQQLSDTLELLATMGNSVVPMAARGFRAASGAHGLILVNCTDTNRLASVLEDGHRHSCWQLRPCQVVATCLREPSHPLC